MDKIDEAEEAVVLVHAWNRAWENMPEPRMLNLKLCLGRRIYDGLSGTTLTSSQQRLLFLFAGPNGKILAKIKLAQTKGEE